MAMFTPQLGWLVCVFAQTVSYDPIYDSMATGDPEWDDWFADTIDIGVFGHTFSPSLAADTGIKSGAINLSPLGFVFKIQALNNCWTNDLGNFDIEFLNAAGDVVAAMRGRPDGNYRNGLWYGPNLATLTKAPQTGTYPVTAGELTCTSTSLSYVSDGQTNRNTAFTFNCDMASVRSMRLSNLQGKETYATANGCRAGFSLRIASAPIGFNGNFANLSTAQYAALDKEFILPSGAAFTHQPGIGLLSSGSTPAYVRTRSVLPGQTAVMLDNLGNIVVRLAYINGQVSLTVGGVTTTKPCITPHVTMSEFNGLIFCCYQTSVMISSARAVNDIARRTWIEVLPGQTVVSVNNEYSNFDFENTYEFKTCSLTVLPANQEPRSKFQPQDVVWRGTPPFFPGPINTQKITTFPLLKGRDYFWIRDGVRNVEQGYISNKVTINGEGVRRRVLCFTQDGELVGETYSRASDGVYQFDLLWLNKRYMLVAQDEPAYGPADYNAVAADYQAPLPYPSGGGVAPTLLRQ